MMMVKVKMRMRGMVMCGCEIVLLARVTGRVMVLLLAKVTGRVMALRARVRCEGDSE